MLRDSVSMQMFSLNRKTFRYYGKMDLQPNHPQLLKAPFAVGDTLYVEECDSLVREDA